MWREQLNVSSGGAAGYPITLELTGIGPKPIINGANLMTVWTEDNQ